MKKDKERSVISRGFGMVNFSQWNKGPRIRVIMAFIDIYEGGRWRMWQSPWEAGMACKGGTKHSCTRHRGSSISDSTNKLMFGKSAPLLPGKYISFWVSWSHRNVISCLNPEISQGLAWASIHWLGAGMPSDLFWWIRDVGTTARLDHILFSQLRKHLPLYNQICMYQ